MREVLPLEADIIKVFAAAQAAAPAVVFIDDADIVIGGWRPLDGASEDISIHISTWREVDIYIHMYADIHIYFYINNII